MAATSEDDRQAKKERDATITAAVENLDTRKDKP